SIAALKDELIDEAVLALSGPRDLALEAHDTEMLRKPAQVPRDQSRIEMKRVTQLARNAKRVLRKDEPIGFRHRRFEAEVANLGLESLETRLVPVVIERQPVDLRAKHAERMPVLVTFVPPVLEGDAELVRRLGAVDEVVLVDAEEAQEIDDRRDRCLA